MTIDTENKIGHEMDEMRRMECIGACIGVDDCTYEIVINIALGWAFGFEREGIGTMII
jgi:hypothetical protein